MSFKDGKRGISIYKISEDKFIKICEREFINIEKETSINQFSLYDFEDNYRTHEQIMYAMKESYENTIDELLKKLT